MTGLVTIIVALVLIEWMLDELCLGFTVDDARGGGVKAGMHRCSGVVCAFTGSVAGLLH